jgi:hypothetical protein
MNTSKNLIKRTGMTTFRQGQQPLSSGKSLQFFDTLEARSAIKGFRYKIFSGTHAEFWNFVCVTEGLQ